MLHSFPVVWIEPLLYAHALLEAFLQIKSINPLQPNNPLLFITLIVLSAVSVIRFDVCTMESSHSFSYVGMHSVSQAHVDGAVVTAYQISSSIADRQVLTKLD